jgi:hypothetical protein
MSQYAQFGYLVASIEPPLVPSGTEFFYLFIIFFVKSIIQM